MCVFSRYKYLEESTKQFRVPGHPLRGLTPNGVHYLELQALARDNPEAGDQEAHNSTLPTENKTFNDHQPDMDQTKLPNGQPGAVQDDEVENLPESTLRIAARPKKSFSGINPRGNSKSEFAFATIQPTASGIEPRGAKKAGNASLGPVFFQVLEPRSQNGTEIGGLELESATPTVEEEQTSERRIDDDYQDREGPNASSSYWERPRYHRILNLTTLRQA